MWSVINDFLVNVDNFVWGVPLMVLIMAGGLLLTVRLGLLQIRKLPLALKWRNLQFCSSLYCSERNDRYR